MVSMDFYCATTDTCTDMLHISPSTNIQNFVKEFMAMKPGPYRIELIPDRRLHEILYQMLLAQTIDLLKRYSMRKYSVGQECLYFYVHESNHSWGLSSLQKGIDTLIEECPDNQNIPILVSAYKLILQPP